MTYVASTEPLVNGTIAFVILWIFLSILLSVVIGSCTSKDTKAERCGHIQYVRRAVICCSMSDALSFMHAVT